MLVPRRDALVVKVAEEVPLYGPVEAQIRPVPGRGPQHGRPAAAAFAARRGQHGKQRCEQERQPLRAAQRRKGGRHPRRTPAPRLQQIEAAEAQQQKQALGINAKGKEGKRIQKQRRRRAAGPARGQPPPGQRAQADSRAAKAELAQHHAAKRVPPAGQRAQQPQQQRIQRVKHDQVALLAAALVAVLRQIQVMRAVPGGS